MWRDRIIEAKKAKGVKTKSMAEHALVTEKTVTRMLNGETKGANIDTVIALGEAVGLTPREIFAETGLVVGSQDLATTEAEVKSLTAELADLTLEVAKLKGENAALVAENDLLKLKMEHKDELIKHKDEIIALLRRSLPE